MHNTINVWYGNWQKVFMKRSWPKEDAKKVGPVLHTDKNFIRNWFLVCKLGYSRKKDGSWAHTFLKKATGISRFVISPLEILDKTKLFIPKKSCKIIWHLLTWQWSQILCDFFFISCLAPGKSTLYLQYTWEIQVLE